MLTAPRNSEPAVPALLTVEEAARVLRIGRTAAYQLAQRDLATGGSEGLHVVRVGRLLRVPRASLEALVGGPFTIPVEPVSMTATEAVDQPAPTWSTFNYDVANELTDSSIAFNGPKTCWLYDNNGERTTKIASPTTVSPCAGTTGNTTTYQYDQAGHLTGSNGSATTFTYNGDGLRTQTNTWLGVTSIVADVGTGLSKPIKTSWAGTTDYYLYDPNGLPFERIHTDGTHTYATFIAHDQLGSTRLITGPTGTSWGTYTYDPYGMVTAHTDSTTSDGDANNDNLGSIRAQYAGQVTDGDTGFQYLRNRFYDATTGNFITRDPLSAVTRQPYGYVWNSPINRTDPAGLVWPFDADDGTPMSGMCVAVGSNGCDNSGNQRWAGNVFAGAGNALTAGQGVDFAAWAFDYGDNFTACYADTDSWAYRGGTVGAILLNLVIAGSEIHSAYKAALSEEGFLAGDAGFASNNKNDWPMLGGGGGSGLLQWVAILGGGVIAAMIAANWYKNNQNKTGLDKTKDVLGGETTTTTR